MPAGTKDSSKGQGQRDNNEQQGETRAAVTVRDDVDDGDMLSASLAVAWECDRIAIDQPLTCD
jgi:hypothetical protein